MTGRSIRHSFYWRIALSYIALILAVLVVQGLVFSVLISRPNGPFAPANPNAAAGAIAAHIGEALEADPHQDLGELLRHTARDTSLRAYVVMVGGASAATSEEELSPGIRAQAQAALSGVIPPPVAATGPVVTSPIQTRGQLVGLVVLPPPPPRTLLQELGGVLSAPSTYALMLAAAGAGLLIFAPARRRLSALERAARKLGSGDLSIRAPEEGRDEIAGVASAFNRMARELTVRTQALHASDELRRRMLADVSHDLKTPLTAVAGCLETLSLGDATVDRATHERYLATAKHETSRLRRIVEDLLDLAKHENDVGTLDVRLFDLERLFGHVRRRHEADARRAAITLVTIVDEGADQLAADPDRIEQVLDNLVANALRHTPEGGTILVRASTTPVGHCLTVEDTGTGIPSEHITRIFDRFYKVDGARTSGRAGSGLGLSIVQAIVARHGGSVAVDSRPGRTVFTIQLPQRVTTSAVPAADDVI